MFRGHEKIEISLDRLEELEQDSKSLRKANLAVKKLRAEVEVLKAQKECFINQWAQSHNTSIEIAREIERVAEGDARKMERIFQCPTIEEDQDILTAAFGNTDEPFLFWGWNQVGRK